MKQPLSVYHPARQDPVNHHLIILLLESDPQRFPPVLVQAYHPIDAMVRVGGRVVSSNTLHVLHLRQRLILVVSPRYYLVVQVNEVFKRF